MKILPHCQLRFSAVFIFLNLYKSASLILFMSVYAAISVSLTIMSFIFIFLSFTISKKNETIPLSYLFFFLGTFFIYISLFSIVELCEVEALALQTPLEYVMTSYMWIWIFVFIYFVVRIMMNAIVSFKSKKQAGESFELY